MATRSIDQRTLEEKLIALAIIGYWPVYMVGGLYVAGAVIGWLVLALVLLRYFIEGRGAFNPLPVIVYLWVLGVLAMLVSLWVAHANWSLGTAQTIKSTIGWMKGWALIAIFIYLGSVLKLNLAVISRAVCITCFLALPFFLLGCLVYAIGGPDVLFVSPLKIVGGPGPEYFEFRFFGLNPETGRPRWFFFAPWAPAAGLLACLFMVICLQEPSARWRYLGVAGCLLICIASQSRAGIAILCLIVPVLWVLQRLPLATACLVLGVLLPVVLLFGSPLVEYGLDLLQQVKDSRPDSTRVRDMLAEIAIQRWWGEAPVWGHGIVERGPKVVEHMPIGTHHSWYGLLFTKGAVGAIALAIPLLCSILYLWVEALRSQQAISAFGLVLVITLYSFFENLEILAYLYWPALLWIGYALNPVNTADDTGDVSAQGSNPATIFVGDAIQAG